VKQALASRDFATAAAWLDVHRDEPEAAFELGRLYRLGKGVAPDEAEAMSLFRTAALSGHTESQYLLGKLCDRQGDAAEARHWMTRAAAADHPAAGKWLARNGASPVKQELFTLIRTDRPPPESVPTSDLSEVDDAGRTPLLLAAAGGSLPWTRYLLEQGANPDDRDPLGATPLHLALAGRYPQVAAALLDAGADPSLATPDGNTALHLAVTSGEATLARQMLSMGADADVENGAGWTSRQLAKRSDDTSLHGLFGVRTGGRDTLATVNGAEDALRLAQQAARRADRETLTRLLDGNNGVRIDENALHPILLEAASTGQVDVLQVLIESGSDLQRPDAQQHTALMLAAQSGCMQCVELIIDSGGRMNARDARGRTALMLAARQGHADAAGIFSRAGADMTAADDLGRNALWWACRADHAEMAGRLLDLGVPIRADAEGTGPLHLAAGNDNGGLVVLLVNQAGRVDEPAGDGSQPLMIAARTGASASVTALLAAEANVQARNDVGDTALIVAVRAGHLSVAEQLLDAGANPNTRNDRFENAISLMSARTEPGWATLLETTDRGFFGWIPKTEAGNSGG
jgi:ankyrin repeat protein